MDIAKLHIVATYNLIYNATHFVNQGLGYALALDRLINITGDSSLCFRPLDPPLSARLYVVWKKHQVFSGSARLFLQQLQKTLPQPAAE